MATLQAASPRVAAPRFDPSLVVLSGLGAAALAGFAVVWPKLSIAAAMIVIAAAMLPVAWRYGVLTLCAFILVTTTNATDVLIARFGVPSPSKAMLAALVLLLLRDAYLGRIRLQVDLFVAFALIVTVVTSGATIFWAFEPWTSYYKFTELVREVLICLLILLWVSNFAVLRAAAASVAAGAAVIGGLGAANAFLFDYTNDFLGLARFKVAHISGALDSERFYGPYTDPNVLGRGLLIAIPFAIAEVLHARSIWLRLVAALAVALILTGLVLTFSRGALVGLAGVLAVFLWYYRAYLGRIILLTTPLVVAVALLAPASYLERATSIISLVYSADDAPHRTDGPDESTTNRLHEMLVGLETFADHPLGGAGLANQPMLYEKYALDGNYVLRFEPRSAHSQLIQVVAETGLLGLAAFLLLWGGGAWRVEEARVRVQKTDPAAAGLAVAVIASIASYTVASVFLHEAYPRMAWVVIALALATPRCLGALPGAAQRGRAGS